MILYFLVSHSFIQTKLTALKNYHIVIKLTAYYAIITTSNKLQNLSFLRASNCISKEFGIPVQMENLKLLQAKHPSGRGSTYIPYHYTIYL